MSKCVGCGKEIEKTGRRQKFCSRNCRRRYIRKEERKLNPLKTVEKVCKYCGKVFETTNVSKIYCSVECRRKESMRIEAEKKHPKVVRKCLNCGAEINRFARVDQLFCGRNCQAAYHRRGKQSLPQKECAYCHEMFTPRTMKQKYCTRWCAESASRKGRARLSPHSECFRKTTGAPLPDMEVNLRKIEKEAREAGMSYGKYQAMLYMGRQ